MSPLSAELRPESLTHGQGLSSTRTNLSWLVRLRWGAIASQLITIAVAELWVGLSLSLLALLSLVGLTALSNLLLPRLLMRVLGDEPRVIASLMALDFGLLTALLYFAGGASNPFSVLYLVHVALSAAILAPRYAWSLSFLSSLAFGSLFLLPPRHDAVVHAMGMHGHAADDGMSLHFRGMWVAFTIAAFVIVSFVTRISSDLEAKRVEAAQARARALRSERLASLATLAAGAAHELGSPLSTIAIVAQELVRDLSGREADAAVLDDLRLIRAEVERCRQILSEMASDAGQGMGEGFERVPLAALAEATLAGLGEHGARVTLELSPAAESVVLPPRVLSRALRGLVRNALDASEHHVTVRFERAADQLRVEVRDQGPGMSEQVLSRVGEPFFTTKEAGRGMGLGVFLARAVLEQLGGQLTLVSAPGRGTAACVVLPAELASTSRRGP